METIGNITNMEIINISTKNGKLVALASYQDLSKRADPLDFNNGYRTMEIPINLRDIQTSVRGNMLVDQSVKIDYIQSLTSTPCGSFESDNRTSSATKCKCGREKWEHC